MLVFYQNKKTCRLRPSGHFQPIFFVLVKYQHFVEMLVNVGILPEHKKYAGSDLLVRAGIFLVCHQISGKLPSICATMDQLIVGAHLNN